MTETTLWVLLLSVVIILVFIALVAAIWVSAWVDRHGQGVSPYTGMPLRRVTDLSYYAAEKTLQFLYDFKQYDNRIFRLSKASFCRDTGRIFQDSVTWYDAVKVDWTFLQKRYPGHYVSWGSLNKDQQKSIQDAHDNMYGFQTDFSSPSPAPRAIEPQYAYAKPGPLYVDLDTKVLLGWKSVPETDLEVLIVQKPLKKI